MHNAAVLRPTLKCCLVYALARPPRAPRLLLLCCPIGVVRVPATTGSARWSWRPRKTSGSTRSEQRGVSSDEACYDRSIACVDSYRFLSDGTPRPKYYIQCRSNNIWIQNTNNTRHLLLLT